MYSKVSAQLVPIASQSADLAVYTSGAAMQMGYQADSGMVPFSWFQVPG
jgi:hypothetical protein